MTNQVNPGLADLQRPVRKKKIASLDRRKARSGWLFILPFILGFLIIYASQVFKLDILMMSIIILCVMSAGLYQGIAWLERKIGNVS